MKNIFRINWLTAILDWIETNEMSLMLSILSVACEAPITTKVMLLFGLDYFHALSSCIVLSFAIIYFTLKKSWMALIFAIVEFIFCGYFFCNELGWSLLLIPALGFTFIVPFSIYAYSQEVKRNSQPDLLDFLERNPGKRPSDFNAKKG